MKKIVIVLSVLLIQPAFSGDGPDIQRVVVASQLMDEVSAVFDKVDSNHDGMLDAKEASDLPGWLKDCKPEGKNQISIVDAENAALKKFKYFAKTNSKFLTEREYILLKGRE